MMQFLFIQLPDMAGLIEKVVALKLQLMHLSCGDNRLIKEIWQIIYPSPTGYLLAIDLVYSLYSVFWNCIPLIRSLPIEN